MNMLSITAYDLLNIIVEGEVTVHVLRLGLLERGFSKSTAGEALVGCLIELCEGKAIRCRVHNVYGQTRADDVKSIETAAELVAAWEQLFGTHGPLEAEVSLGTISVETTELGAKTAVDRKYDVYLPFLRDLCGWPNDL